MADKKIHSLFDDLWGNNPSRNAAPKPATSTKKVSNPKPSVNKPKASNPKPSSSVEDPFANLKEPDVPSITPEKSVDIDDISSLLDDLKKNLLADTPVFSPENTAGPSVQPNNVSKDDSSSENASEQDETSQESVEEKPKEKETDPMEDLSKLVGLDNIKKDVSDLVNLVKMQKMRQEQGMKSVPVSLHLVFSGNPGTGKTTVARILARLYKQIGVLSKGQLVEVDRSALVAGYVGQTATKTHEKIKEAMGGILFIDEAYTLVKKEGNDFGQEAIDTLLKEMEDHRDEFVVIVAGYTDLMEQFINSNPGLKSRFNKYMYFEDYTKEELLTIFQSYCDKYQYHLDEAAQEKISEKIGSMIESKDQNFANAREVRNLFEKIITKQANRIGALADSEEKPEITLIVAEDIE